MSEIVYSELFEKNLSYVKPIIKEINEITVPAVQEKRGIGLKILGKYLGFSSDNTEDSKYEKKYERSIKMMKKIAYNIIEKSEKESLKFYDQMMNDPNTSVKGRDADYVFGIIEHFKNRRIIEGSMKNLNLDGKKLKEEVYSIAAELTNKKLREIVPSEKIEKIMKDIDNDVLVSIKEELSE